MPNKSSSPVAASWLTPRYWRFSSFFLQDPEIARACHDANVGFIGAAYTASCLTGVFWLALQMFRVVLRFHRESKK